MAGLTQKIYRTLRKVKCDLRRDVSCFTPALAVAHALCDLPLRGPVFQPVGRWAAKRRDAAIFDYLDQNYGAFFETFARQWTPPEKRSAAVRLRSGSAGSRERSRRRSWCGGASQAFGKMPMDIR